MKKNNIEKENLDGWMEAKRGFYTLRWGELHEKDNPEETIVVDKGGMIQGLVTKIEEQREEDELKGFKINLRVKEYNEPVIVWSNKSFFSNLQELDVGVGDEIQLIYEKDYTARGKICKSVKLRVKKNKK